MLTPICLFTIPLISIGMTIVNANRDEDATMLSKNKFNGVIHRLSDRKISIDSPADKKKDITNTYHFSTYLQNLIIKKHIVRHTAIITSSGVPK